MEGILSNLLIHSNRTLFRVFPSLVVFLFMGIYMEGYLSLSSPPQQDEAGPEARRATGRRLSKLVYS